MQQVTIGIDTAEMLGQIESLGQPEIDFGIDELDDEDSDVDGEGDDDNEEDDDDDDGMDDDDDYEEVTSLSVEIDTWGQWDYNAVCQPWLICLQDWVSILDHEDDENEGSEGSLGDWAKLDTMRSSHPMHFARRLTEVTLLFVIP